MDMYQALRQQEVTWDALEAASYLEYQQLGNPVSSAIEILRPDATGLFGESLPPAIVHTRSYGLGAVMLMVTDSRLDDFTPEAKEHMRQSLAQTVQLYLLVLGNLETFAQKGQPPEKTFGLLSNLMQELSKVYDLLTDPEWPPDDEPELPF